MQKIKNNFTMFSAKHRKIINSGDIGKIGEEIASKYLQKRGHKIVERNYREKIGEIDIVSLSTNKRICFIEVKTLSYVNEKDINMLSPEKNFSKFKLKKTKRISEMFSAKHQKIVFNKRGLQIDLIAIEIYLNKEMIKIRHYKNIN